MIGTGETRREDGRHGSRRAAARTGSRRRRRGDGAWRTGGAGGRSSCSRRSQSLLDLSREGRHAASDYLETAALTGLVTIGCRRAGGGLAGAVTTVERLAGSCACGRSASRTSSSSTGAAPRSRRSTSTRAFWSAVEVTIRSRISTRTACSSQIWSCSSVAAMLGAVRAFKGVPVVDAELRLRPISPLQGRRGRGVHDRRGADRSSRRRTS